MSFIKIKNPLDKELTLQFIGENYVLKAKEEKAFPSNVSEQWIFIYDFIESKGGLDDKPEVKIEVEKEVKKEMEKEVKTKVTKK